MKYLVLLDLDNVLADFWEAVLRLFGRDPTDPSVPKTYDLAWLADGDANAVWRRIESRGEAFWIGLQPTPWALDLYMQLKVRWPVVILTSPSLDPASLSGKAYWIRRYLDTRDYLIGPAKWACAAPGHILIDDCPDNCKLFQDKGGDAVLLRRPWSPEGVPPDKVVEACADIFAKGCVC